MCIGLVTIGRKSGTFVSEKSVIKNETKKFVPIIL